MKVVYVMHLAKQFKVLVACFLLVFAPHAWVYAQQGKVETIKLNGVHQYAYSILTSQIISLAYERIGIKTDIQYLPAARALANSSNGEVDGEVARIYRVGELYPNLIRVPAPFLSFKGKVFTNKPHVIVKTPTDLAKYRSGIVNGIVFSRELTQHFPRIIMQSAEQLFRMLISHHPDLDLVITTELGGMALLSQKFSTSDIRMAKETLIEIPIYHYLHKSKQSLIPRIEKSLRKMTQSGETLRMKKSFMLKGSKAMESDKQFLNHR